MTRVALRCFRRAPCVTLQHWHRMPLLRIAHAAPPRRCVRFPSLITCPLLTPSAQVSMTEALFVQAGATAAWSKNAASHQGFDVKTHSVLPLTLRFTGPTGKFKVVAVTSC